jgi:hypothetical protein
MIITPRYKLKLMSITKFIWNHTGILIMTTKFLFTKEEVAQMKAAQNLADKINNLRAQKRRNDAEDRATAKAEENDE